MVNVWAILRFYVELTPVSMSKAENVTLNSPVLGNVNGQSETDTFREMSNCNFTKMVLKNKNPLLTKFLTLVGLCKGISFDCYVEFLTGKTDVIFMYLRLTYMVFIQAVFLVIWSEVLFWKTFFIFPV